MTLTDDRLSRPQRLVLDALAAGPRTWTELRRECGSGQRPIGIALAALVESGRVRVNRGAGLYPPTYELLTRREGAR